VENRKPPSLRREIASERSRFRKTREPSNASAEKQRLPPH
jgi:hypothetical protein